MELEHKGTESDDYELINGENSPKQPQNLEGDENNIQATANENLEQNSIHSHNSLQNDTQTIVKENVQIQQEILQGSTEIIDQDNHANALNEQRSENRIEEEHEVSQHNSQEIPIQNEDKMLVEEEFETRPNEPALGEIANATKSDIIQDKLLTENLTEDSQPINKPQSSSILEENPFNRSISQISADERPLKGKGSYDFNNAFEATPNRRNTTIGVIEGKIEGSVIRARASTIQNNNKDTNTSFTEDRPLTGREAYNDERPIGGKGGLNISEFPPENEEKPTAFDDIPISNRSNNTSMQIERPIKGKATYDYNDEKPIGMDNSFSDERPLTSSKSQIFSDDRPLKSARGNFDMINEASEGLEGQEEYSQGASAQEVGPLSSRVKSKVWKVRQSAFEELVKTFSESKAKDPIFQEYSSDITKYIADANPGAQEKAIEALKVFIEKQGTQGLDTRGAVKTLIDKALGPGKPSIKKISNEVLCLVFEKGDSQTVYDGIIESINHKNQKTSIAGVQALRELLINYGAKKLDYLKVFFPHIEKLAASTVSGLRTEAMNFYKEAYNYMGEGLRPFLVKLKKAQQDELDKYFSEAPKQINKPLRGDNNDVDGASSLSTQGNTKGAIDDMSGSVEAEFDPYDIMEPVDIFKKFNEDWADKVLEQGKWSDKKALLEDLLKEASITVKIANTPYQHIVALLKKTLNDNNITVIVATIKIYAALAKGLRKNFNFTCKITMPTLLAKLKDKRAQIISETCKALDNFLYCISPDDVIEDLKEALIDKTPEVKIHTASWIERACEKNRNTPEKLSNQFKNLISSVKKMLDDSSGDVRESAMKLLAKWKVVLSDSVLKDTYNDIPAAKQTRINELIGDLGGRGTAKTTSSTVSSSTPNRGKGGMNILNESMEEEKTSTKPPSKALQRPATALSKQNSKPGQSASVKRGTTKPTQVVQGNASKMEEEVSSNITSEDAENKMVELGVSSSIITDMNNNVWKEKLKGLSEFNQWINNNMVSVAPYLDHVCKYLKTKLKDWKESNLTLLKETFSLLINLIQSKETTLTKRAFNLLAPLIAGNIHDTKYSESCQTIVYAFIEAINPKSVFLSLINSMQETKTSKPNPKALVEISNFFAKLVEELTLKFVPLKELIDFGKTVIGNTNPAARTAATNLFKAIYQQMGPPLNDMINDINPQTLKALSAEFDKIIPTKELQCRINFREDAESDIKEMANANPLDSLPRADISKEVEKLYKKLTDNDWKVRKEGLDALESVLAGANNRILPNGLYDLVAILKARLNENNKSQAKSFIIFVGKFATALGSGAKVHAKVLVPELIRNLSDKQAAIRQEALSSIQKFTNEVGSMMIINNMLPLLTLESPEIRSEIMNWILKNSENLPKAELKQNISPLLGVLQDKNKDIRNLAEKLLEKCINVTGTAPYISALKDLKPAIQKVLKPIIEKYKGENEMEVEALNVSIDLPQPKTLQKTNSENNIKSKLPLQKTSNYSNFKPNEQKTSNTPTNQASGQKMAKTITPRKVTAPAATHHSSFYQSSSNYAPLNNSFQSNAHASTTIIHLLGHKQKRLEDENRFGWSVEELQDESVDLLKDQLKMNVSPDLYVKMFSVDSKKNLDAIVILKKALVTEFQGTIDILDLICKWFFLKLFDNSNPQLMKESLDYILSLVLSLEAAEYSLLDFEATVLVASLIPKLGASQRNFQATLHKVFQKLTSLYPANKICVFLLHGMNSTNAQTRTECIDVLAKIIQIAGPDVLTHKDIRVFGRLLGHNDSNIRNKAMNIILELGKHIGEDVLNIVDKEAPPSYVEEIRTVIQAQAENTDNDNQDNQMQEEHETEPHQPLYNPTSPNKIAETLPGFNNQSTLTNETVNDEGREEMEENQEEKSQSKRVDSEQFERSVYMLVNGSVTNKLDALLLIHDVATSEDEETKQFFKERVDSLIQALRSVLNEVFEKPRKEIPAKFLIYFLNMTHKLCSIRIFLKNITEDNLREFSEEVLNRLLSEDEGKEGKPEEKQLDKAENESLVKTLNSTMLRILENSDPNDMFCVLFDLLIKNRRRINNYSKILGLIIKCILKLTKALEQLVNVIQPEKILLKSHMYLLEFGTDPAKLGEDIGIKTIKTILNELVKLYRENIWEFYAQSVQTHPRQDNYIHRWITVILRPMLNNSTISPRFPVQGSPRGRGANGDRNANQEEMPSISLGQAQGEGETQRQQIRTGLASNLPQNLEDLHNKGINYKTRFGWRANNENQSGNIPSQNQANRGMINNNTNPLSQMNNQETEEGSDSGNMSLTGQSGQGTSKATESILQKLSEMKLKVASIVKTPSNP